MSRLDFNWWHSGRGAPNGGQLNAPPSESQMTNPGEEDVGEEDEAQKEKVGMIGPELVFLLFFVKFMAYSAIFLVFFVVIAF